MQMHTMNMNQKKVLINKGSGTHQTYKVPENLLHRSSVNESNNDEIEREITTQNSYSDYTRIRYMYFFYYKNICEG